ncbi:MAG: AMP-dependent synthetase [Desulfococcus sp. 4484_241]|nr:MAG: AMP-dependent synthetase [Desulfococcus sp. 4484_241]
MDTLSPNIVSNALNFHAMYNPDSEAIVYGQRRITWKRLGERVNRLANALIEAGVRKNDKVALMFHNCPEFIETNYAIQSAGAIPVPVNYRFTANEIKYQLANSDASFFFFESTFSEPVEKAAFDLPGIKLFICDRESGIKNSATYGKMVEGGAADIPQVPTVWEDVAVMIYTGGTTGFPKGVMLTYGGHADMFSNLFASIINRTTEVNLKPEQLKGVGNILTLPGTGMAAGLLQTRLAKKILASKKTYKAIQKAAHYLFTHPRAARIGYKSTVKFMTPSLPFFHDASYQVLMLALFTGNLCQVIIDDLHFNEEKVLKAVENERPKLMANVPTGWKRLVSSSDIDKYDKSSIIAAVTGAGVCTADLKRKIFEKFPGVILLDIMGQTEMTPITTFRIDTGPETLKNRSVGKSILDVRVVDENGNDLPRGETGELMYRSSWIMKGYYKDEKKTSDAMRGGWFLSGDLGYIDEDGEIRIVERKKECINTGGEKVFPLEVEEVLHKHPDIDDVCVIGVPDEEWGNILRAVVKPRPGKSPDPDSITEFCRGKLAGYKIPRSIILVDELPLSPVGKMLRSKIRELYGKP